MDPEGVREVFRNIADNHSNQADEDGLITGFRNVTKVLETVTPMVVVLAVRFCRRDYVCYICTVYVITVATT